MKPVPSVQVLVQRALGASVQTGVGRWADGDADAAFGQALYDYGDAEGRLTLFAGGLLYSRGAEPVRVAWRQNQVVHSLLLTELAKVHRDPEARVTLAVSSPEGRQLLNLPMKLYTTLCPLLVRLCKAEGS